MKVGVDPYYVEAATGVGRTARIDPGGIAHVVDAHVDFGATNHDQRFQLLVHTREDGVLGGVTSWGGQDWPVEGRMAPNMYTVRRDGTLWWYRHDGRPRFNTEWQSKQVGTGWGDFHSVFGGGDGVLYAIRKDGVLLWYHHDGRNQGTFDWRGANEVGTGWAGFQRVFAGDGGVVYAITTDGRLLWYRHLGRRDGTKRWLGPTQVGTGWEGFRLVAAGPDGTVYAVQDDGTLVWYRHYGHDQGYPIWHGPNHVGQGWQPFDALWPVGNGYVYARTASGPAKEVGVEVVEPFPGGLGGLGGDAPGSRATAAVQRGAGELWLWRHHGFLVGDGNWTAGVRVGTGWGFPGIRLVTAT
jgi:hypothetical protein